MEEKILNLKNEALAQIVSAKNQDELERLHQAYLGRKGKLSLIIKEIPNLPLGKRVDIGRLSNDAKKAIEEAINRQQSAILIKPKGLEKEWIDVTSPGIKPEKGHLHPQTQVLEKILNIFNFLGYQVAQGPEIETDWYNFEILNIPKDHPSRDTMQTLYLDNGKLLRTHTSSMQGRVMEKAKPPFRVVVPGKCFRFEQVDPSHGFEFWQVEGFAVDKNITLTDLFGTISYVLKKLFGEKTMLKFACTNFPFVEPGVDTYMKCTVCQGKGCSFCKNLGWSEIMPAGMIHPGVLEKSGIDPQKYSGFAFAIGLSRIVNLMYQMNDLRLLTLPDLRILNQF
ncbi:phenylalanine--tRNA ligase subunit alpha [Candidatus Shapirobacteria bacterium CG10_big_fil_rev_8_21_14_0_10_40_9]|uniref:Phenylalanine--tRNA ligase alpha subunit n=1 Tax=Candidatus Shapirobacteria bacterium CG10_big_fil_rev_8_21_14_0_10_40_9 TaxID=1974888 RepID=A0A2M8L434_9BACT|nr:MAG: phenylalanine--tRNA ligase subunit alpha [Candidatus Shapirobacteria bacterium CG10_big_fil_rev_8_21_14_0_10_40_9]